MGSIYRRENSKYYWVKYYRNGKSYQESTHSDKIKVAEKILKIREGEIAQGRLPGICFDKVRFDEIAEDYLVDYRINRKKTVKKADYCVRYLKNQFENLRVTEVTTSRIKLYIEKRMKEGAFNATINRELSALKRMFNVAVRCTPPKAPQVPYIPMLKEDNVRKGFFEHEDFLALLNHLPSYLKPVAMFAYCTGWRKEEILSLTWKQVDLDQGTVRLEPGETKNDEGRTIYMEPELLELISELHRKRLPSCPYVFQRKGQRILEFRKAWKVACDNAEVPGKLFHDLRRTAIRTTVRAGIPERVAMLISGHKTRSVFDRYNIVSPEDLKEAARKKHEYGQEQASRLHFSYTGLKKRKKVIPLKVANL